MKRLLSVLMVLALALSLCPAVLASGEVPAAPVAGPFILEAEDFTLYAPADYVDAAGQETTGVINGYYAATAPIVLTPSAADKDELLAMGYVVAVAHGGDETTLRAAAEYIRGADDILPGDAGRLILRADEAAAVIAAKGGLVYAAQMDNPVVANEATEEAIEAAIVDSAEDYAGKVTVFTITEAANSREISPEDAALVEGALAGVVAMEWTEGTSSGEPTGTYTSGEAELIAAPAAGNVPGSAITVKPGAGAASYVRINWNMACSDGSYTGAVGLGEAFREAGVVTQLNLVWDEGSDTEAFCAWVDRICRFEHDFTTAEIETTLDLGNSLVTGEARWELSAGGAYYVLQSDRHIGVVHVARPELPDYQGVSVAVPAEFVKGINPDGTLDIDWEAEVTNSFGMTYTAATAPIVMQTGATGYSVKQNYLAATGASTGFITVEPGNRGKYSQAYDAEGNHYYTGDAPLCSTDQKSVVRWLRYNNALGYIPGDIDRIVTWGGSGGGAHSTLICAGDSPYYAEYLYANGALGVDCVNGEYVYLDGFSDAIWGSCPGGAVTNLEEANMLYEFETWLSTPTEEVLLTLEDGTPVYVPANLAKFSDFYKLLSYYMVMEFVEFFNVQGLVYDIDGDGTDEELWLGYDPAKYPETNGLYGTYVDLFLQSAEAQLEWYLDNIDAARNNTYLNENGESDVEAFMNGHYTYISTAMGPDAKTGPQPGIDLMDCLVESWEVDGDGHHEVTFKSVGHWEVYRGRTKTPLAFDSMSYCTENEVFGDAESDYRHWDKYCLAAMTKHYDELNAAYAETDSSLYDTFEELYQSFANDCIEIVLGQEQSGVVTQENIDAVLATLDYVENPVENHNAVWIYNPMQLFLDGTATLPTWVWTVTGAADSDSSNLVSMNDAIALTMGGTDAVYAWTWGAGHGSNTPLNTTQNGVINAMMAKYGE